MCRYRALASLVIFVASSCNGGETTLSVADGDVPDWEAHRRRMNLTIVDATSNQQSDAEPEYVAKQLKLSCVTQVAEIDACVGLVSDDLTDPHSEAPVGAQTSCTAIACWMQTRLCVAHGLLEIANAASTVRVGQSIVHPQREEARTGASEVAIHVAREALLAGLAGLQNAGGRISSNTCSATELTDELDAGVPVGESIATSVAEAYWLAREAGERAIRGNLAVADAAFDEQTSSQRALRYAYHAPVLSRGHAAHLLLGHHDDDAVVEALPGDAGRLFGAHELSGRERQALEVLREAGLSPQDIEDPSVSVGDLLAGSDPSIHHTVLVHQKELYGDDVPAVDAASLYAMFGLAERDFASARQRLVEELRVYRRSRVATLPARPLPPDPMTGDSRTTSIERFASTSTPPRTQPDAFWARRALEASEPNFVGGSSLVATAAYAREGLSQALEYAHSHIADLLRLTTNSSEGTTQLSTPTLNGLALIHAQQTRDRIGRLVVDVDGAKANVTALGRTLASSALVIGDDGLRCAIYGTIEGAECDLDDFIIQGVGTPPGLPVESGYQESAHWIIEDAEWVRALDAGGVYLVDLKDGASEGKGKYEGAGGVPIEEDEDASVPVNRWANALTASAIGQGPDFESQDGCAGPSFERIPLENELSEDHDALESSWRTYLSLARRAADEADQLGGELIEAGLSMDLRSESALHELETLCGSAVDIDGFLVLDSEEDVDEDGDPYGGPCPCTASGTACHAGVCVMDPLAGVLNGTEVDLSSSAHRLRRCLGAVTDPSRRLVSLGTRPLCVWVSTTNEDDVCGGSSTVECPFFATTDDCDPLEEGVTPPMGYELQLVPGLGVFDSDGTSGGAGVVFPTQSELKRTADIIRVAHGSSWLNLQLAAHWLRVLDPSVSARVAEGLEFEAYPYNTGMVLRGGDVWFGTGSNAGLSPDWPCSGPSPASCGSGAQGLLCHPAIDCGNEAERATFTTRLAEAVLAARIITGAGLEGLRLPVLPDDDSRNAVDGAARAMPVSTALSGGNGLFSYPKASLVGWEGRSSYRSTGDWQANIWVDDGPGLPVAWGTIPFAAGLSGDRRVFAVVDFGNAEYEPDEAQRYARTFLQPLWDRSGDTSGIVRILRERTGARSSEEYRLMTRYWPGSSRAHGTVVNRAAIAPRGFTYNNLYDAIELLIEASIDRSLTASGGTDPLCDPNRPPQINSVDDLPYLEDYMKCVANRVEARGERTIFADLPEAVTDVLRNDGGLGVYPELGGRFAEAVTQLRRGLVELQSVSPLISREVSQFSQDVRQLTLLSRSTDLRDELSGLRLGSAISDRVTQCAVSIASISKSGVMGVAGGVTAAAVTCVNTIVQIVLAVQSRAVEGALLDIEEQTAFSAFLQTLSQRIGNLETLERRVRDAQEDVDQGLAALESIRTEGSRAIAQAVFADSDEAGRMYRVNTVMRRRFNSLQARYERSRDYAVRMAYLAKIALEQRLGLPLEELGELSLVEDPKTWSRSLCLSSGIDYERIRNAADGEFESFQNQYIGDYVRRLEAVVESYRLDYPFSDGADTAVVSLRDDVFRVRRPCEMSSINLLDAADPSILADEESGAGGWEMEGCDPLTSGDVVDCVGAIRFGGTADSEVPPDLGPPDGYAVVFGSAADVGDSVDEADSSFRAATRLVHRFIAEPGRRYRLSWYGVVAASVNVLDSSGAVVGGPAVVMSDGTGIWGRFYRFFDTFDSDSAEEVRVAVLPQQPEPPATLLNQVALVAGFMVEDVTGRVLGEEGVDFETADYQAPRFHSPEVSGYGCEDTDGFHFRPIWGRVCERRCPAGLSSCDPAVSVAHCYREASFTVTPEMIEAGRLLSESGFAVGNFNYRIESLVLNFVGTGLRDCSEADSPSTCYASGSIPFDIDHLGPFEVVNHRGEHEYEAPLFSGRVSHGRGLAAERYLTNPLSTSDRALIDGYHHRELRGRPLAGTFRVRLWEEPGVRFNRLEDVQLVLNYRYWTRLD